jgi:curli biogenesis system outer membrane secretion channel CsgG
MNALKLLLASLLVFCTTAALAQDAPQGKTRLAIGPVKILPSLYQLLKQNGQETQIRRIAETIDSQLTDALHNTRKFELVARSDLAELQTEQRLADPTTRAVAVPNADNLALITIDDFVDQETSTAAPQMNLVAGERHLRMSCIVKIYNARTGILLESMAVPVQSVAKGVVRVLPGDNAGNPKAVDDSAYVELVNQMSQRVAQRITDTIYPAKILAIIGDTITINRGSGTLVDRGQVWEVFTPGREIKDPDTGEILGREETKMGEIVITEVEPRLSKAQAYGENRGIAPGNVARIKLQMPPRTTTIPQPGPVAPAVR